MFWFFFRSWFICPINIFENNVFNSDTLSINNYLLYTVAELLPFYIKNLPALFCILFAVLSLINFNEFQNSLLKQQKYVLFLKTSLIFVNFFVKCKHFLYYRWYSDKFFDFIFFKILSFSQWFIVEIIEKGLFDILQISNRYSLKILIKKIKNFFETFEDSNVQLYIGFIIISFFSFFLFLL